MDGAAEDIVFRKHPFRMFLEFLYLLFWLGMAFVFAVGLLSNDPEISKRVSSWFVFLVLLGVLTGGWYLIRLLWVRGPLLQITPKGLFYPLYGPDEVPWSEVVSMDVEESKRWSEPSYIRLDLTDGKTVEIECEFFTLNLKAVLAAIEPYIPVEAPDDDGSGEGDESKNKK